MTVLLKDHLRELRRRLLGCLAATLPGAVLAYVFRDSLMDFLTLPVGRLYFFDPAGAFMAVMRLCWWCGLGAASPVLAWQAYAFLAPALSGEARTALKAMLAGGLALFFTGCFFGLATLGASMHFLLGFARPGLQPMISVDKYLSLAATVCLGCGLAFQAPLAAWSLARAGLCTRAGLRRRWRVAVLAIFVAAALVTPTPDIFNQALFALPMGLLYGLSIWVAGWGERGRQHAGNDALGGLQAGG